MLSGTAVLVPQVAHTGIGTHPLQEGFSLCQQAEMAYLSPDGPQCGKTDSLPISGPGQCSQGLLLKTV
jgi:hypothetical protein